VSEGLRLRFLIPGDLAAPTGGYRYDRRIIDGFLGSGVDVRVECLDDSFPWPTADALEDADERLAGMPDGELVVIDGLAFGALGDVAVRHATRLRLIALVHHPLAEETGVPPMRAEILRTGESRALAAARRVVVTSAATGDLLGRDYGVTRDRIRTVEPGTEPAPLATGSGGTHPNLLCVASAIPRKGHDILFQALAPLVNRPWRLDCVGSLTRCPTTVLGLQRMVDQPGLRERVRFTGAVSDPDLDAHYRRADLFVLPTRFEGYGMVLTEALARGLPIVSTRTGPIPSLVPEDAGLLVEPDDPAGLREALTRVLDDAILRADLAAGARAARDRLRRWDHAVADFRALVEEVRGG
jgi:glycosyltransferase involved in cell wall biosynthesis